MDGILGTSPVGSFKSNALGFYDLGGNATEWMLDGFDAKDPKARRVLRGGVRKTSNANEALDSAHAVEFFE